MKGRAAFSIGPIFGPDAPAMGFNESPTDCQAQTNSAAASFVTTLYLIKTVEDTLGEGERNTWPGIGDMQSKSRLVFYLCIPIGNRDLYEDIWTSVAPRIF